MTQYSPRGFSYLPPVVKNLIIINIICFLASEALARAYGIDLVKIFGLHFFKGEDFHFYQYITYMFLHGGVSHLFFNMFALWMFGYILENIWGPRRFLIFYFVTGFGAALTHTVVNGIEYYSIQSAINEYALNPNANDFNTLFFNKFKGFADMNIANTIRKGLMDFPNDKGYILQSVYYFQDLLQAKANIPTIGASGSVYGILLAFGMMFPNQYIFLYFLVPIKAKWFVIAYGALELFSGIASSNDGIAHFAHLGGMLFGFFLIRYWKKNTYNNWE